jgi:hypothetical protein
VSHDPQISTESTFHDLSERRRFLSFLDEPAHRRSGSEQAFCSESPIFRRDASVRQLDMSCRTP